ncbi:MAG: putative metal-dependent hydrolase [Balneolaceae bacterium]|nr:putative metal-dependent hydrolase [Balneolaceae bacterium]
MHSIKYPIGTFQRTDPFTFKQIGRWIEEIKELPSKLEKAVVPLDDEQLDTPYRSGGWSVKEVVHHIADSHMNGYVRIKWALTEKEPTIKTYNQEDWAELADYQGPVELSLALIDSLHARWGILLGQLGEEAFNRTFIHPENGVMKIGHLVQLYAWHGNHHLAHITTLLEKNDWASSTKKIG